MLIYKLILGVILSVLLIGVILLKDRLEAMISKSPNRWLLIFSFVFRLFPFIVIYIFLGFDARSDVLMFYDSAKAAAKGGIVYRDFDTAYSPLFPYITVLPLWIWDSAKAIILEMVLFELLILWATIRLTKISVYYALIYLMLPATFILSVLGGQEDILMWGALVLALLVFKRYQNYVLLGLTLGFGLLVTKALLVLFLPAAFFFVRDKAKFLFGLLLVGIPSLIILFLTVQWGFLSPVQQANDPRLPNIWSVLHPLTNGFIPLGPKWINWVGLLSILCVGFYFMAKRIKTNLLEFLPQLFLVIYLWLMISQQSSVVNYAYSILMPLIFVWKKEFTPSFWLVLLLFNLGVILQAPLWWGMGMIYFHSISDLLVPMHALEYFLELLVVGSLFWFLKNMLFLKK